MDLEHFPFVAVTVPAFFVHLICAVAAGLIEPVWKNDTFLDRWWGPAQTVRFFTVKRSEVKWPVSWRFILAGRAAFFVCVVSLILDLIIS